MTTSGTSAPLSHPKLNRCRVCQARSGLRIVSVVLLSACVVCTVLLAFHVPVRITHDGMGPHFPLTMTTGMIALYSWLATPVCLLANQGLWFWCRRAHGERASLRSLALMLIWFAVGCVGPMVVSPFVG